MKQTAPHISTHWSTRTEAGTGEEDEQMGEGKAEVAGGFSSFPERNRVKSSECLFSRVPFLGLVHRDTKQRPLIWGALFWHRLMCEASLGLGCFRA